MDESAIEPHYFDSIKSFQTIDLKGIKKVKLLNRHDTKYIIPIDILDSILYELKNDYYVLKIENNLINNYDTTYFDTESLSLYRTHQNGKKNRFKVRVRTYVDSRESFLEIKLKNNKGRTSKKRKRLADQSPVDRESVLTYVQRFIPLYNQVLTESLNIKFSRITLTDLELTERITIDLGLNYKRSHLKEDYPRLVIIEIKQDFFGRHSLMIKKLIEKRIFPFRISKYCLGIYSLYDGDNVKKNFMKAKTKDMQKRLGATPQKQLHKKSI